MFTANSTFIQGSTHRVCQDYARSAVGRERATAIVADGCSSSSHTDVGARDLVIEALYWAKLGHNLSYGETINHVCEAASRNPSRAPAECLDATLLVARADPHWIRIGVWGDGWVVLRHVDGTLFLKRISFLAADGRPSGFPVYPAYFSQPDRLERILRKSPRRRVETWAFMPDLEYVAEHEITQDVAADPGLSLAETTADYDLVAVMSDGADSFYQAVTGGTFRRNDPVSAIETIRQILDFKSFAGPFVERRVKRALSILAKDGITHADDFSFAAIHIDHEGER